MAATASLMGNMEERERPSANCTVVDPSYSLEQVKKIFALRGDRDQEPVNRFIEGLKSAGLPERPPLTRPDKPTIAVLPFLNMMGDPQQDYLCDGMAEQLITGLSQSPDIYVIARTSSFAYRGKAMTAQQIAGELGMRYLIEGSVQRAADRLRINVQLIDGKTGNHMWADDSTINSTTFCPSGPDHNGGHVRAECQIQADSSRPGSSIQGPAASRPTSIS